MVINILRLAFFLICIFFLYQGGLCLTDETRQTEHAGAVFACSLALLGIAFTILVNPTQSSGGYQPKKKESKGKVIPLGED